MTEREEIDLGDGHNLVYTEYKGQRRVGAHIEHIRQDGSHCKGFVPFAGRAWANEFGGRITTWDVIQEEPLTLAPSILCRACGDHGFIRNGKWVRA